MYYRGFLSCAWRGEMVRIKSQNELSKFELTLSNFANTFSLKISVFLIRSSSTNNISWPNSICECSKYIVVVHCILKSWCFNTPSNFNKRWIDFKEGVITFLGLILFERILYLKIQWIIFVIFFLRIYFKKFTFE